MDYNEQLQSDQWKKKREEIISRDNSSCKGCHVKRNQLLGLIRKFGINSYNEIKAKGYSVKRLDNSIKILLVKNKIESSCIYIGNRKILNLNNLRYALQWVKPQNPFAL
ncbi:hypothetical protein RQM65_06880 [Pricia sp. S334]|uniref:Uncharacterized protein n=1 Tax=Pricia mediterranea TaxID=3076079 RepID=A0ABU3L3W9_9FLAO|nr:hypothetical protein [Pricia sp. S334]MDT7828382.1 hypothetical protein [Pricia sp. S334]